MGHYFGNANQGLCGGITAQEFHFGDFTLDQSRYRLQKGARLLRLEKLPMELLILLVQRRGELVSREEIAEHLWGKDVFVDVDHSINTAVRKIRQVLKDDPEKPRFVETVVGKGYRFAAPVICRNGASVSQAEVPVAPVRVEKSAAGPSMESQRHSMPRWTVIGAVGVLASLIVAGIWFRGRTAKPVAHTAIKSIAVLPLKNLSGDPSQDYLADGMTEELIGRLSRIHDLRVISRTSVMHYKDTQLSMPEIARTLRVDALVEGSVIREGNRIRVHAQLIRGATDEHFWSETYDRELRDVLALESDVAQSIAGKVEVTVTGQERERLTAVRSVPPEVYESYLKGRFALDKSNRRPDVEESIRYFEQAIKIDPTFAPAYVGLADAYDRLATVFIGVPPWEMRPKVVEAAHKALELDSELAEAYVPLADVQQQQWQWADAEAGYRRALELNPNDAAAHRGLAHWLLFQGRIDEALTWSRRARELDPLGDSTTGMGWILFCARRYDEAIHELRSKLALRPDDALALWVLGFVLVSDNRPEEAIPVLEKAVSVSDRSPGIMGVLVAAYAHAGRRTDALRLLAELKTRNQKGYVPAAAFITAYLGLGDYDEAFVWLERAYQEQSNILQFLKVHPFFDPVRNDPRFVDLLHRIGLDQAR
jgi:TolB-like protein/DNA-binding winged helix-turn-helix (wHTH) protein/Flp pilus assembly protein TadD